MWWLIKILVIVVLFPLISFAQGPTLRRVCVSANDNELYFTNNIDTCLLYKYTLVFARNGLTGPFNAIDTIKTFGTTTRTHFNANIGPGSPNWFYCLIRVDSCGSGLTKKSSDTLQIDNLKTEQTYFDSVSVDPYANKVQLGWKSNLSKDFNKYFIYTYKSSIYNSILSGGTKDTFLIHNDIAYNPSLGPITYDINTTDSCGNPSFLGVSLHSTIYLQHTLDTCNYTINLSWSPYIGWSKIKAHQIYQDSSGVPLLIASTGGGVFNFSQNYIPGKTHRLFIRAVKDTSLLITSSSNLVTINTPNQTLPRSLGFNYVSSQAPNGTQIEFKIAADANNNTKNYIVKRYDQDYVLQETLVIPYTNSNIQHILNAQDKSNWNITIEGLNWCNITNKQGDTSCNILLKVTEDGTKRVISWNSYFTWNNGIKHYQILRGTGNNGTFNLGQISTTLDTFFVDSQEISIVESEGICYQIVAVENDLLNNQSHSNMVCVGKSDEIFVPNAFAPNGINKTFKPEGAMINYSLSEMEIYNRWGEQVYYNKIDQGWDGTNQGKPCDLGVYIYKFKIVKTNNETVTKSGSVTLLR